MVEEEFEIIPVSPLRRLEKRIEKLETFSAEDPKSILKDIVEIVRMNQQIVDELAKSNDALRIELSKLPGRLDELINDMRELIAFIKASGESEQAAMNAEMLKPVVEKLDALVSINKSFAEKNDAMMELLDELNKKLKRTSLPIQPTQPMPIQPQPSAIPPSTQPLPKPGLPLRPLPQKPVR
jgi:hypothetical protein